MATQPETRLQRRIQKALKKRHPNSWWFKVWGGPFQSAGIPDLVGCVPITITPDMVGKTFGLFCAEEVKLPIKSSKPSELQLLTIEDITYAGGCSGIVRSTLEAVELIECHFPSSPAKRKPPASPSKRQPSRSSSSKGRARRMSPSAFSES